RRSGSKAGGARLRDVRDIALVGFGGVYAFGYLARAVHSWDHNLGVLPGAELQYFVAGLLLLVPPAIVLLGLFGLWRLFQWIASWELRRPQRRARIDAVLGTLLVGGIVIFSVSNAEWFGRLVPVHAYISAVTGAVFGSAFTAFFLLSMVRPAEPAALESAPKGRLVSRVLERIGVFLNGLFVVNLGLMVVGVLLFAMLVGMAKVLPVLPQALGGAAPRCAQFDVDVNGLTRESIALLFEPDASPDVATTKQPRRSRQVLVFYAGADSMRFKLPDDPRAGGTTYELKRSAIDAVRWCGAGDAARDPTAAGRS